MAIRVEKAEVFLILSSYPREEQLHSVLFRAEMDEDSCNPYEVNSFHMNEAVNTNILYAKKRKLQAEQLGLPMPKHKCWDDRLPPEPLSTLEENEVEELTPQITNAIEEKHVIDEESDCESVKDSNSLVGDSDFVMSVYNEAKSVSEVSQTWPCDKPSTSSCNWESNFKGGQHLPDNEELACMAGDHEPCHLHDGLEASHSLEAHYQGFEARLDYSCRGYDDEIIKPCTETELDILFSHSLNPNAYLLSSGRWDVSQDAKASAPKPTIDQEFEQYFSTLML